MTDIKAIEQLTDDERGALHWYGKEANKIGQKALRMIAARDARIAELEVERSGALNCLQTQRAESKRQHENFKAAECRADAAEARIQKSIAVMTLAFGSFVPDWPQGVRDALEALRGE